ncbi:MAG: CsiV family protein, partial [Lysobacterales bacterium]
FPDLLEPLPEPAAEDEAQEILPGPQSEEPEPVAEPESIMLRPDLPDDLVVLEEKSQAVDDAWRRLRGSSDYRPLLYAGWEQNRVDYYPPVRVHDLEVVETRLLPPVNATITDPASADAMAANRRDFYRLDGSVQLRRSRFLHLYLDIEYRESGPWLASEPTSPRGLSGVQADAAFAPYTVFVLKQNRQVRTGRMQYFDTPQFGALVLVTAIAPEPPQESILPD